MSASLLHNAVRGAILGVFMAARGHCLLDTHRFEAALTAYSAMVRLAPTFKVHAEFVAKAELGATKGIEEFRRVYGNGPERGDPSLPPASAPTQNG